MKIDFTKIEWDCIADEELQFYYKEAVDANEAVLKGIDNTNNKVFQFLAISSGILAVLTGLCLSVWGEKGKDAIANTLFGSCIGFVVIIVILLIAVWPRKTFPGRALPEYLFSSDAYKKKMRNHYADGIASYHKYILLNYKVQELRNNLLVAGILWFMLVPVIVFILRFFVF